MTHPGLSRATATGSTKQPSVWQPTPPTQTHSSGMYKSHTSTLAWVWYRGGGGEHWAVQTQEHRLIAAPESWGPLHLLGSAARHNVHMLLRHGDCLAIKTTTVVSPGTHPELSGYAGWYFAVYVLVHLLRGNPPHVGTWVGGPPAGVGVQKLQGGGGGLHRVAHAVIWRSEAHFVGTLGENTWFLLQRSEGPDFMLRDLRHFRL